MFDQETWKFINSFAPWLAAIGTVAAVITALYLARKDARIQLKVRALIRFVAIVGTDLGPGPDYVSVEVSNVGRRVATVTYIYWKTGIFRKKNYVWLVPQNPYSANIPVKLHDGEQATFMDLMTQFERGIKKFAEEDLSGWASGLKGRFVRVGVGTSTGDRFEALVDKSLRARFLEMARKADKTKDVEPT
ncbi:MAG: hypothetical protein ACE5JU_20440 [Candidatus Binatia bacterium]